MKRFVLILTFLAGIIYTHGQIVVEFTKYKNRSRTFANVEVKGTFPRGDTSWRSYLEKKLITYKLIGKRAKKGKYIVVVKYIVMKDGSIDQVSYENDPGYGMCSEVIRLIKKGIKWRHPSEPVEVKVISQ